MSEAELCLKVEAFFSDCEIYKEVPSKGGRCDLYIKQGELWIAVEVKLQFSFKLVCQALRNMPSSNYSYVAVPFSKSYYSEAVNICKKFGVGVLMYIPSGNKWRQLAKPVFRRKIIPLRVLDRMKQAVAGVQNNPESAFKITLSMRF